MNGYGRRGNDKREDEKKGKKESQFFHWGVSWEIGSYLGLGHRL
jgi:hypothetical protein